MLRSYTIEFKVVVVFFTQRYEKLNTAIFINISVCLCFQRFYVFLRYRVFQPNFIIGMNNPKFNF